MTEILHDSHIRNEFEIALQTELIGQQERNLKHIHAAIDELKGICTTYPNIVPSLNKEFLEEIELLLCAGNR
jgi:hypothetical protein